MRALLPLALCSLVTSCGESVVATIPARLAELQAKAVEPARATEAEIEDRCRSIASPGVHPYGTVVGVDGWSVAVRIDGAIEAVQPSSLVLLTNPQGARGFLRVSDVVGGHAFGCLESLVEDRSVSIGDYAQPVP